MAKKKLTVEEERLAEANRGGAPWKKWGPYLSERQWGTVREDYSENGDAWNYFTHDQARSRAYRWGEDGLAGISDDKQQLCFALALWNGVDPILKERLFGLSNSEANHGEDVKEYYYYLDNTPTHSYMKYLYKYPQAAFPYGQIIETNKRRSRDEMEYELIDTGVFDQDRYFDVFVEYAKAAPDDIAIQITAHNRGPDAATLHILPTLWFRNTWAWGDADSAKAARPELRQIDGPAGTAVAMAAHPTLGERYFYCEGAAPLLFTENETQQRAALCLAQPHVLRQRWHQQLRGERARGRCESGRVRDEDRASLRPRDRGRRERDGAAAPQRHPAVCRSGSVRPRLRERAGCAPPGGRCLLRDGHAAIGGAGASARPAPGVGWDAVDEAVLLLRPGSVARENTAPIRCWAVGAKCAIVAGSTWSTTTSSRCRTSGNIRGMRRGTWPSTLWR